MNWHLSHRADSQAVKVADRHYNRQKIGTPQFVPPGRCLVLATPDYSAVWVTSWPFAEYVKHQWGGAWVNSLFRNEGSLLSSELIRQAVAATLYTWPDVPSLGLITFVDSRKIKSSNPGYCYLKAGFKRVGKTKGGLVALQLLPSEMPEPEPPMGLQFGLFNLEVTDARDPNRHSSHPDNLLPPQSLLPPSPRLVGVSLAETATGDILPASAH